MTPDGDRPLTPLRSPKSPATFPGSSSPGRPHPLDLTFSRQIREVLNSPDSPLSAFGRLGADDTYPARKVLRNHQREDGHVPRYNTDPVTPLINPTWDLLRDPQGFRRQYLHTVDDGRRFYVSFLDHLQHLSQLEEVDSDEEAFPLAGEPPEGTGVVRTFLITLKGFVGSSVLYLASAWASGGVAFSMVGLAICCLWNYLTVLLLLQVNERLQVGYGEMARILVGPWLGALVDTSLVLLQLSVCVTYFIFVGQSLLRAVDLLTNCRFADVLGGPTAFTIACALQLLAYLPLSSIMHVRHLTIPALVADLILFWCILCLVGRETALVMAQGPHPTVAWGVGPSPSVLLGIGLFAFEGIGLVLPIASAMKEPRRFPLVFAWVSAFLLVLMAAMGLLGYVAFGAGAHVDVLLDVADRSSSSAWPLALLVLYPVAIVAGYPIQFFPAAHILEHTLGCRHDATKRRALRVVLNGCLLLVATQGGKQFSHFVSLAGALCAVPLAMIYPPILHYVACAGSPLMRLVDTICLCAGVCTMVYVLIPSLTALAHPSSSHAEVCIPHR
eukprot:GGOE01054216.1.p1 GENE.GGOE01054216.1~~GGOE01054216.1.p1  ORF type:complete len:557 (+),score=150.04 GGOE01054216.1:26-1696(+)